MVALFYYSVLNAVGLPLPNGSSFYTEAGSCSLHPVLHGCSLVGNEEFLLRTEGLQEAALAAFVMLL
jgi:hypothetical protein